MSEWWTYHLSDFLLFSRSTYYRLFEIYNAAIWPAQVAAVALGILIVALLWRRAEGSRGRVIAAILAACWLWVGIAFHASRYATINWAAIYFAWAFGVEAALLIWMGVIRGSLRFDRLAGGAGRAGLAIFLFALALEPFIGPLLGRGWRQIEIFGVAPDPTAVATLGILVAARCRGRWLLMIVPAVWCAITGAALLAMKAPAFWVPPAAAAVSVVAAAAQARREGSGDSFDFSHEEGLMRTRNVLAIAALLALTSVAVAQESGGAKAGQPIPIPAADLKWVDLDPTGAPGVKIADLWGDHTKGAFGAIFKLPAGFAVPLHKHLNPIKLVIISGTYIQGPEGKPEFRLGPGSYLMQPGGNYWHTTSCDKASECIFFAESKGKFNLEVKDAAEAPGKS